MGTYACRQLAELCEGSFEGPIVMNPSDALEAQLQIYRRMTGEERLAIALRLHELACDVCREGIRHQYPKATPEEVEQELKRRIQLTYQEPNRDGSLA